MLLLQILLHTPHWVFGAFIALLVLGMVQLADRRAGWLKVSVLPLAMLGWSFWSVVSTFDGTVVLGWGLTALASAALLQGRPLPEGTAYDPVRREFALPGSVVPLVLMMGIFFTKYAVGVALVMAPALGQHTGFTWAISALYGALSGSFLGRATRLWRLALPALGRAAGLGSAA